MAWPTFKSTLQLDFTIDSIAREHELGELAVFALLHSPPYDIAPGIPRDRKYAVDTALSWYKDPEESSRRENGDQSLNAYSQSVLQLCGPTRYLAFSSGDSGKSYGYADPDMHQFASSQLVKEQRPDVRFINADNAVGPALLASISPQQMFYSCVAHDFQDELPLLVENSVMWRLECKSFLQETDGLQTPRGELLAIDVGKTEAKDDVMRSGGEPVSFEEFQQRLRHWTLPVVVKLTGGMSGSNFILRTDEAREECVKALEERLQQYRRPEHAPFTGDKLGVLIQELKDVEESFCVNFCVPRNGDGFILGVAEQILGENSSWAGARIDYSGQDSLKQRFQPQILQLATKMRNEGFVGVAGVDIVCSPSDETGWLVDINPRINGSLILPACQTHFTSLGYNWATVAWLPFPGPPRILAQHLAELQTTRGMVLKAFSERADGNTIAMLVIGAADGEDVMNAPMELFPKLGQLEAERVAKENGSQQ
ncbi:Uncharacterized protein BP5553_08843 [Venustampulla echinocandica]|uniref:ATP-grasp domain-containing protein n=1 Tax=Venustampulla echinocandica TaxID=2656787 RepID=A0A370TD59_9HELO|nr:Uncharacterized protein BP5553_08843 [Venustampulla echinocandica]RDL32387.1 Uncharacterized protein BP5553_08843 [Venustampulla echinocandica]